MPSGGYTGSVFSDLIEKTYRRLSGNQRENVALLNATILYGDTTFQLNGLGATGLHAGALVAMGTEVMLITDATINIPAKTSQVEVVRGYQGSVQSGYPAKTVAYVDPRFTRWDIATAINDALGYLSSPTYGLFQVLTNTITYNPVLQGYDFGAFPADFLRVVELTYDQPYPNHNFPPIKNFRVRRGISSNKFPSGRGLIIYEPGWPGLNLQVAVAAPFSPLVNLNDDVEVVSGLDSGAIDLLPLCAEIDITIGQEIKRSELGSQTDPAKLQNVPPASVTNAVMALKILRDERVGQEATRLAQRWPEIPQGF